MSLPQFKLLRPRTLEETLEVLARVGAGLRPAGRGEAPSPHNLLSRHDVRILAGGTDLIPSMQQKLFEPEFVLDLRHVAGLRGIRQTEHGIEIGALTTLRQVEHSDFVRRHYSVLAQAAATVASPVLRNMGTIGGNICLDTRCLWYNQSLTWRKGCGFCIKKDGDLCHVAPAGSKCWAAFSGDTPPALLCLDAQIEIANAAGVRRIPLREFYTGEGDSYRRIERGDLLTRVILPASAADFRGVYRKLRVRGSIDYPLAGVAVALKRSNGLVVEGRVALTAVNPAPVLVKGAREMLAGREVDEEMAEAVGDLAAKTAKPLTTSALTPEYRREMIRVFAKRALLEAWN